MVLRTPTFTGTEQGVFHLDAYANLGDFAHDVAHGWVVFVAAMVFPLGPLAVAEAGAYAAAFSAPTVRVADQLRAAVVQRMYTLSLGVCPRYRPAASASKRASAVSDGFPTVVVRAAVVATMGEKLLVDAVDESVLTFDIRPGNRSAVAPSPSLSRNFTKLRL